MKKLLAFVLALTIVLSLGIAAYAAPSPAKWGSSSSPAAEVTSYDLPARTQRYIKGEDGKMYLPHTLNNTVVAPPRMLIAFLENHLQADGSVTIPEVLWPYMGGTKVLVPKK